MNSAGGGKCANRRRQVGIRAGVTRDHPADQRQHLPEVPEVERADARHPRHAELENRQPPAGRSTRAISRARHLRPLHVADAEGDVTASADALATGRRMASPRTSAMRSSSPAARTLRSAERQHRAGEIHADHARRARRPGAPRLERDIGRAGATSTSVSRPVSCSESIALRAPAPVDPGAEQVIEQVVARRDRIEHAGDAIGRLVGSTITMLTTTARRSRGCWRAARRSVVVSRHRETGPWRRNRRCRRSR